MKNKKLLKYGILTVAAVSLISCGGGGGGSSSGGGSTPGEKEFLYYTSSVYLVDKDNLTSKFKVFDKSVISTETLFSVSSLDENTGSYSGLKPYQAFFISEEDNDVSSRNGGKIYKLLLSSPNSSNPVPQQITSISDACDFKDFYDDILNKKAYFVVQTAGDDGLCDSSDDGEVFISSDMNSTDSGITGKKVINSIQVFEGSTVEGFIVKEGTELKKCNTDLSECETLLSNVNDVKKIVKQPGEKNVYYCILTSEDTQGHIYEFNGSSLNPLSYPCDTTEEYTGEADEQAYYFEDNDNLKRLVFSSNSVETVYDVGTSFDIKALTNNYVVIKKGYDILAIKKDGSNNYTLVNGNTAFAFYILPIGTKVIFNEIFKNNGSPAGMKACYWEEGGSVNCSPENSKWVGLSIPENGNVSFNSSLSIPVYKLMRVEGANFEPYFKMKGGTLKSIKVSDMSTERILGNVPNDFDLSITVGIGSKTLVEGIDYGHNCKKDIFFVDVDENNSLQNITNTPDEDEESPFSY